MVRVKGKGWQTSRCRQMAAVGLATATLAGVGLFATGAGASSKVTITIWNDPLAAGSRCGAVEVVSHQGC